jgi:hypothetical protein
MVWKFQTINLKNGIAADYKKLIDKAKNIFIEMGALELEFLSL